MTSPVSTHAIESGLIQSPIQKVWAVLSTLDFTWWKLVESSALVTGTSPKELDSTIKLSFKDGIFTSFI